MPTTNHYVGFVSDAHFLACARHVCGAYPTSDNEIDLVELRRNTIDPFKMVFDIINSGSTVDRWIRGEVIRQNDKTLNNTIGEFHQKLLGGVDGWVNLGTGDETGVDLRKEDNTVFMELKNKFNTVNSGSLEKVRDKLEAAVERYPRAKAYWAYILERDGSSGERVWLYRRRSDERIRRIFGKKVYELVTGDPTALESVWNALPKAIGDILGTEVSITDSDRAKLVEFFNASLH